MVYSSPYEPVNIPSLDLWDFLFAKPRWGFPESHVIMVDIASNERLTFGHVKADSIKVGKSLIDLMHWQKGDVLAICSSNSAVYATMIFSTLWAGGVVAPLNALGTVEELTTQLKLSNAKAVATCKSQCTQVLEAASLAGIPSHRIVVLDDPQDGLFGASWSLESLKNHQSDSKRPSLSPNDDLAFLVFSSGTTGLPKGVMLSHQNIVANILQLEAFDQEHTSWQKDRNLGFIPMYHIYGLAGLIFQPFSKGITSFIMKKFELQQFCQMVEAHAITFAYVVPPVVLALLNNPVVSRFDLSSLRMLHSSAAPLPLHLVKRFCRKFGTPIKQGYGASEAAPGITSQTWVDWDKSAGSSGRLLPSMHVKIMDGEKEVALGASGELYIRGPNIFKGYLDNPDATRECLDANGYYRTGDIGFMDENQHLFITDRVKELIKYNGWQIAPAELEAVILSHPAIKDAAVVGIYDEGRATEVPKAYVVARQSHEPGPDLQVQLHALMHDKVAPYKRLRGGIEIIDEIPRSAAGKILRRSLIQRAGEVYRMLRSVANCR